MFLEDLKKNFKKLLTILNLSCYNGDNKLNETKKQQKTCYIVKLS